ncbi:MAG TPA: tyrosine-type recombinase/integrase [Streptosporangiaceae bacterium]|nr:tyrosine-type recombinase/integrase [Streptosporangiaceae bacterium]
MTREETDSARDLGSLVVPAAGALVETGDLWEPYYLSGPGGGRVVPVSEFLRDLQATRRPATTQRSYVLALLRWFRFTWAVDVRWDQATRVEARDFCRYLQLAGKPGGQPAAAKMVPGKRPSSGRFAPSTVAHCETVCRSFYAYHLEAGTGPIVNPFPLARPGRAHAHHNPMEAFPKQKAGLFRPKVPQRVPKQIPDAVFNELFARLGSHRDRALVAFWVSAGARASELLSVTRSGADPGQQLITVIRKGSRAIQQLPASPDAFVWLRLYQQEVHGLVPAGPDDPLWWTLRRPFRPLTYDTARKMFDRANDAAGTGWTLHSLRHTAAYRLARDPDMPITDVQWVLGHALLSTTQIYVVPTAEDVIEATLAHHRRRAEPRPAPPEPAPGYRSESLDVLFGKGRW